MGSHNVARLRMATGRGWPAACYVGCKSTYDPPCLVGSVQPGLRDPSNPISISTLWSTIIRHTRIYRVAVRVLQGVCAVELEAVPALEGIAGARLEGNS